MTASPLVTLFLPLALGIIMLGLGLSLTVDDFRRVVRFPKAVIVALLCQVVLLPGAAFGLALAFDLPGELALGVMLLAAGHGSSVVLRVDGEDEAAAADAVADLFARRFDEAD